MHRPAADATDHCFLERATQMSVIRVGSTEKYAAGWDTIFGGRKAVKKAKKASSKKAAKNAVKQSKKPAAKKSVAKKSVTKKPARRSR
jgi:hypothetical protein